jgi:hypothetical protein
MKPDPACSSANEQVKLATQATDAEGDSFTYKYTATGGRIDDNGASAVWDLSGLRPGEYRANVFVRDSAGNETCDWVIIKVAECGCVDMPPSVQRSCADISVGSSADSVQAGESVTLTANVSGADAPVSYNWIISGGSIVRGQGSPSIVVDTSGLDGRSLTGTVEIGGLAASCPTSKSVTVNTRTPPRALKIDSFGAAPNDDIKARMDNFVVTLQQDPSAQGYIIAYGSCGNEGMKRAQFMKDYLVKNRGMDASRVVIVDGGCRDAATYDIYTVPQGAPAPVAENANPCRPCKRR